MKNWFVLFLFPLFAMASCSSSRPSAEASAASVMNEPRAAETTVSPGFIFGYGDELSINVWRNEDLSSTVAIDPDGNISLPLIGSIRAVGMTVPKLRDCISEEFGRYVVDPHVVINISNIKSQRIFVLGEVLSQGSLSLDQNMMTWEAISRSGGFTDDANTDNVLLIRNDNGVPRATAVNMNLRKMLDNDGVFQNPFLQNCDIVYVPPRRIASVEKFMTRMNSIISPVISLERGIVMVPQVMDAILHGSAPGEIIVP